MKCFLKNKLDGSQSVCVCYARERLRLLVKHNFLKIVRLRVDGRNYYIGTKLCFEFLDNSYPSVDVARPSSEIDIRTFDHDSELIKFRIYLEKTSLISKWRSERFLKRENYFFTGKLQRIVAPDAIYQKNGQDIAFEYEISKKSEDRYREKVKRYVSIMRNPSEDGPIKFSHCRFVCKNAQVYNSLKKHTVIYGDLFSVEMADRFFEPKAEVIPLRKENRALH